MKLLRAAALGLIAGPACATGKPRSPRPANHPISWTPQQTSIASPSMRAPPYSVPQAHLGLTGLIGAGYYHVPALSYGAIPGSGRIALGDRSMDRSQMSRNRSLSRIA